MSDFKAKMHQIQFRLAPLQIPLGELTALPRSPDLRGHVSKEREEGGVRGEEKEGEGKGEMGQDKGGG